MSNPYQSPPQAFPSPSPNEVKAPAIALMVVSIIAIVFGILGLIGDAFLILWGLVGRLEEMNEGPISEYTQITIRAIWGVILVIASSFVLYGAIKMKNMKDYGTARAAAIIALVPLLGPCCVAGIPFGVWALTVLNKPHVRESFQ